MSNEITLDEIKVGDRIKAREVYKNGDTFEGEVTVTHVAEYFIYTGYRVFHKIHSDRESLTIERVAVPEPKKIGTVIEYMWYGGLETAVLFTLLDDVKYPWIRASGHTLMWDDILAGDPNPKVKED